VVLGELFVLHFQNFDQNMQFIRRIIEAVVGGVSFLEAGTIFVSRIREHVQGLTTAASIWATAAVGFARSSVKRKILNACSTVSQFRCQGL
jgi:putative Mg2+ transporter-C (MgtC) family protein